MKSDRVSEAPSSVERGDSHRRPHGGHERSSLEKRQEGGDGAERLERGTRLPQRHSNEGGVKGGGGGEGKVPQPKDFKIGPTPEEREAQDKQKEAEQKKRDADIEENQRKLRALMRRIG